MNKSISQQYILNAVRRTPSRLSLAEWNKVKNLLIPGFASVASIKIHQQIGDVTPINFYNLDHIYPIKAFNKSSAQGLITALEVLTVFHPDNYCWLLWKDNLQKSSTYNNVEFLSWTKSKTAWIKENLLKSSANT